MILFSEFKSGSNVTITTPSRVLFSVPGFGGNGEQIVTINNEIISYSANLFNSGSEIREESPLVYGIISS
jgi:hypothetical protein